jgi:hypothetical protein
MDPATDSLPEFTEALNEYNASQMISWEQLKLGYDLEPADFSQTEETMSKAEEVEYEQAWDMGWIQEGDPSPKPVFWMTRSDKRRQEWYGHTDESEALRARRYLKITAFKDFVTLYDDGTWSYDAHPQRDGE